MKRIVQISLTTTLLAASAFAIGQPAGYTGPSAKPARAGYAGPSSVPMMTVKDLLEKGKDDQAVRVRGRLTGHKGGEEYEFADQSGRMTVEIDDRHFPAGVSIDQNTVVELSGEFDKETFGNDVKLEVDQMKVAGK